MDNIIDCPAQAGSNSLPDLAARIVAEHRATDEALKSSVQHAINAGELLLEAKVLVQHGQWLPWLKDHCSISERTAQLYMRCAKNKKVLVANTQPIADLSLNEVAALLMLSSDIRKFMSLVRDMETLGPEELVDFCVENEIAVIKTNPFGATPFQELSEPEQNEWRIWTLFGVRVNGLCVDEAMYHTDRLQTRGWSLSEWYGSEGDRYRRGWFGKPPMPQSYKDEWFSFLEANRSRSVQDLDDEIRRLYEKWTAKKAERERKAEARKKARMASRRIAA